MSTAPSSVDMLKRLVAFDTTSRKSNLELIQYFQDYLDDHGVKSTLVPNEEGTKMRAKHPDANITMKRRSFVPSLLPQENEEAATLALQWTGGNRTYAVPYGTEAGIFRGHGIPTVICGPGDIAQAHQPNEFVAKSQMDACDAFLGKMTTWAERQ